MVSVYGLGGLGVGFQDHWECIILKRDPNQTGNLCYGYLGTGL